MPIPSLLPTIEQQLNVKHCPLVGCIRANLWSATTWRGNRGNAILALVGIQTAIETPYGSFDIYLHDRYILQFRGGTFKNWWEDDCKVLCAVVAFYTSLQPLGVILFQELDGKLSEHYIEAPSETDAHSLVEHALADWASEGRIAKNSPRAAAVCPHCSVKRRCDAKDMEDRATADWPPNWRIG